jgi:hypothetical protein
VDSGLLALFVEIFVVSDNYPTLQQEVVLLLSNIVAMINADQILVLGMVLGNEE